MFALRVPAAPVPHGLAVDPREHLAKGETSGTEADVGLGLREFGLACQAGPFGGGIAQGHRAACWRLGTCWMDKRHSPLCPPLSFNEETFVLIAEADA